MMSSVPKKRWGLKQRIRTVLLPGPGPADPPDVSIGIDDDEGTASGVPYEFAPFLPDTRRSKMENA